MDGTDAGAKNREEQDMKDREEYFCRAAARQSLFCAVWIVALVALIAWLA
jgi:hypothetical protein